MTVEKDFDFSYALEKQRKPNSDWGDREEYTRLTPFESKTYLRSTDANGNQVGYWYPVYTPYDATENTQGIVWLSDSTYDDADASDIPGAKYGMTAATPKALWTVRDSLQRQVDELKGSTGSKVDLSTVKVQVKLRSPDKDVLSSEETLAQDSTAQMVLSEIPAGMITGELPISAIPAGARSEIKTVDTESDKDALTGDDVKAGDTVYVNETGKMYIVVRVNDGVPEFKEYSSGSAATAQSAEKFTSPRTIRLTGDVTGESTSDGSSGWTISTSVSSVTLVDSSGESKPASTYDELWNRINGDSQFLPVSKGGTGAGTASDARKNLGLDYPTIVTNVSSGVAKNIQYAASDVAGGPALSSRISSKGTDDGVQNIVVASPSTVGNINVGANLGAFSSLQYNPSTSSLSANITGNAATATNAERADVAIKATSAISANGISYVKKLSPSEAIDSLAVNGIYVTDSCDPYFTASTSEIVPEKNAFGGGVLWNLGTPSGAVSQIMITNSYGSILVRNNTNPTGKSSWTKWRMVVDNSYLSSNVTAIDQKYITDTLFAI